MDERGKNGDSPPRPRGRKRRAGQTEAILRAAAERLLEVGFDRFRIQDVAARAECGIGAIYRRWPSKEALVADAIRNMPPSARFESDDPHADLRAIVRRECDRHASKPDRVPGLVSAMQADEGIQAAVREGYDLGDFRTAVGRVIGMDHPHLSLLAELTPAILLLRSAFAPEQHAPEQTTEAILALVDTVAAARRGGDGTPKL